MPISNEFRPAGWTRIAWAGVSFLAGLLLYNSLYFYRTSQATLGGNSAGLQPAIQLAEVPGAASENSRLDKIVEAWPEDVAVVDRALASPTLEPYEVVQLQMESLQAAQSDLSRLAACYSLASPGNRKLTGPFEQFSMMLQRPPYDTLWQCRDWQIGATVMRGSVATVLVTVIGEGEHIHAFRFVLERQSLVPYADCWMTSVVQPMTLISKDEPKSKATATSSEDTSLELQAE